MKKVVAIVGSAVLVAGATFAGDKDKDKTFSELDQNQDHVLTQVEASIDQELSARFDAADAIHDSKLTSIELVSINDAAEEDEDAE